MAFKLTVLPQHQLVLLTYSGRVSSADFQAVWAAVAASDDYSPQFDDLVILGPDADYCDVAYEVSMVQARKFVEANRPPAIADPKRTAFLCFNDMQIAMARMFVAFVRANSPTYIEVDSFRALAPAIDWLEPAKGPEREFDRIVIRRALIEMDQSWCCEREAAA